MTEILVVMGHPNKDSFGAALADAYVRGARSAGGNVRLVSIADLNFDPVLHKGYDEIQHLEPDLQDAQAAIEHAQHVVWVFPMWWVNLPALLRGFIDRVFVPGWAFKYEGGAMPKKLLDGRSARVVVTMDSPRWWYWLGYGRAVWRSFNIGTLWFSGFSPVSNTPIHSVGHMSEADRSQWLERMAQLGTRDAMKVRRALPNQPIAAAA